MAGSTLSLVSSGDLSSSTCQLLTVHGSAETSPHSSPPHSRTRSTRASLTASATQSVEDGYDEDGPSILYGANVNAEYYAVQPDYLATDTAMQPSPSFLAVQLNAPSLCT